MMKNYQEPFDIKHSDFVRQIYLKELLRKDRNVNDLRDIGDRLDAIFGDDTVDYPHVQK